MSIVLDALKNVIRTFLSIVLVGFIIYGGIYLINKNKQDKLVDNNPNEQVVDQNEDTDEDNSEDENSEEEVDMTFETITYQEPKTLGNTSPSLVRTGTVNLVNEALVGTDLPGNVDQVLVNVGDVVEEGQVLFTLKKNDTVEQLLINLDSAEKQLQSAYRNLDLVKQSSDISESSYQLQFAAADMALQQAVLNLNSTVDLAERQLGVEDMSKDLQEVNSEIGAATPNTTQVINGFISQVLPTNQEVDQDELARLGEEAQDLNNNLEYGQRQLQLAQNYYTNQRNLMQIENAKLQIESTRNQIASQRIATAQNINQLQTQVSQAEAQVKLAKLQLNQTSVKAPTSGKVMSIDLSSGVKVDPGVNYISIASQSEKEVNVNVSIEQAMKLQKGQNVIITYAGEQLKGLVKEVGLVANPQTRLINVKINQIEKAASLVANSFIKVEFVAEENQTEVVATVVPLKALDISNQSYKAKVWENGEVMEKNVSIAGPIKNGLVKIVGGLEAGDEIIVSGLNNDLIGSL